MIECSNNLKKRGNFIAIIIKSFATFKNNFKKLNNFHFAPAFTLAEVLIVLGIIGIVAAMTVPNLVQKYTERANVVKLKRAYAVLTQAYRLAQEEWGEGFRVDFDWSQPESRRAFLERLIPYLKVAVDCKGNTKACFVKRGGKGDLGHYLSGLGTYVGGGNMTTGAGVLLMDGTLITIHSSPYSSRHAVRIMVDINGPSMPNRYAYDTFFFKIENETKDRLVPLNAWEYSFSKNECKLNATSHAVGCAWWVLKNGNQDYLHCDLNWKTQTKCN